MTEERKIQFMEAWIKTFNKYPAFTLHNIAAAFNFWGTEFGEEYREIFADMFWANLSQGESNNG